MQLPIEWLPADGAPEQLIVLLHGLGSDAMAMAPLAQALRNAFPQAAVLAPDAPTPFERGGAAGQRQWYGIAGLTPETWQQRVATGQELGLLLLCQQPPGLPHCAGAVIGEGIHGGSPVCLGSRQLQKTDVAGDCRLPIAPSSIPPPSGP